MCSVVIGTENREILILTPAGSAIAVKCTLPSVPVFMAISGTLDVEYRITVACRDNNVYTVKVSHPHRVNDFVFTDPSRVLLY